MLVDTFSAWWFNFTCSLSMGPLFDWLKMPVFIHARNPRGIAESVSGLSQDGMLEPQCAAKAHRARRALYSMQFEDQVQFDVTDYDLVIV